MCSSDLIPGEQIVITPEFSDGESHDYSVKLISGEGVISVDNKAVTALREGEAEIEVRTEFGNKTATVIVFDDSWDISFMLPGLQRGAAITMTPTVSDPNREVELSFTVVSGEDVVAIEDGNKLRAIAAGEAEVACVDLRTGKTKTAKITVTKSIPSLSAKNVTVTQDATIDLPVTEIYNYDEIPVVCTVLSGDGEIEFTDGKIKGIKAGSVEVEARYEGTDITATFTVIVNERHYEIEAPDVVVYVGDDYELNPTITPAPDSYLIYEIVSGSQYINVVNGVITAKERGEATVKLSIAGTNQSAEFRVSTKSYVVNVENIQLFAGEEITPTPVITPDTGRDYKLTLVSGSSVQLDGKRIIAVSDGESTVRCTLTDRKAECIFKVKVTECKIMQSDLTLIVGESAELTPTVEPEYPGHELTYTLKSGGLYVKVNGNKVTANAVGKATVRVALSDTLFYTDVSITVINYTVEASNLSLYVGDKGKINPVIDPEFNGTVQYEVVEGEEFAQVDVSGEVTALKEGVAKIRIRPQGTSVYKDVTVSVKDFVVSQEDLSMYVNDFALLTPTVDPDRGNGFTYEVIEGGDNILLDGTSVHAVKPGEAKIRITANKTTAYRDVTVEIKNYVISVTNIGMYVGQEVEIVPGSEPYKSFTYVYSVVGGTGKVEINGHKIKGVSEGVVEILCKAIEVPSECTFFVSVGDYAITVDDVTAFVGDSVTAMIVLVPSKDDAQFTYEIVSGSEYIEIDAKGRIKAVDDGEASVKVSLVGSKATWTFKVTVTHEMQDIPEGYVKINDYLYASIAAGRHKTSVVLNFVSPYKRAEIYYNTNFTPITSSYGQKKWNSEGGIWLVERTGSYNDYVLTQQVDAALTWAGGNKNYSGDYVNKAQNGGQYNFINLSYVYNVAVVLDGELLCSETQSYIVTDDYQFDNIPIISLSMPANYWFDGIPNGRGESVYNNVYIPGGNAQASKTARVNLEFFDENGSFSTNSQVKVGGGWSRGRPQRTLHLNFLRNEMGEEQDYIQYEIFGDATTQDDPDEILNTFSRFRLHNGGSTYDNATRFNDAFAQAISKGLNVSTTAWRPAVVYLNGEYWGLYHLREHYADVYFKENYDVKKGNVQYFDYGGGNYNLTDGDVTSATAFIKEMTAYLDNPEKDFGDDAVYDEFFGTYVDAESLMDLIVIQTFFANWDWVGNGNNHRAWRTQYGEEGNPYTDGKLRFCLHDIDFAMQAAYNETLHISHVGPSNRLGGTIRKDKLINRALASERFRYGLWERANYILENYITYERACVILDEMVTLFEPQFEYDRLRWWKPQTVSGWKNSINGGKNWIRNRKGYYLPELKRILGIYDSDEQLPTGNDIVYTNKKVVVNEYWAGNGSVSDRRFALTGFSVNDYEISAYAESNGIRDLLAGSWFIKLRYHATNNGKTVVMRFNEGKRTVNGVSLHDSRVYVDVKEGTDSAAYEGFNDGIHLYEGIRKITIRKQGTSFKLYIDSVLACSVTLPDAVANSPIIGLDLYQHNANMIYRNLVIKRL